MSNSNPASTFIAVARIVKERGIKGEVKALPLTGAALQLPPEIDVQVLGRTGTRETMKIRKVRYDRGALLVSFYDVSTREKAAEFRQATIEINSANLPELPEQEYYHHQILGLTVMTAGGDELGRITEILETGGADVYIVQGCGKEYLIPAIRDVISCIDLASGIMTVTPLQGLLD